MDDINVVGTKKDPQVLGEDLSTMTFNSFEEYKYMAINAAYIYKDYIENKGYDLIIDDICDTLDISENYVQRYIIKYLDRIVLTKDARVGFKYIENINFSASLLSKKILINRASFFEYLARNLVKEKDSIVFSYPYSDFENMNITLKELKLKISSIESMIRAQLPEYIEYNFNFVGQLFQSIDNMKIRLGLRHNVQIYRLIDKYSYQKFKLNKYTVRYVLNDDDINKFLIENKNSILHPTVANISIIENDRSSNDNITNEELINIKLENYALSNILHIKTEGSSYDEIRDNLLYYLADSIKGSM